jgi:hypothetical protein
VSELGVAARGEAESGRRNGLQVGVQVANNRAQKAKLKTGEQPTKERKNRRGRRPGPTKRHWFNPIVSGGMCWWERYINSPAASESCAYLGHLTESGRIICPYKCNV